MKVAIIANINKEGTKSVLPQFLKLRAQENIKAVLSNSFLPFETGDLFSGSVE